MALTAAAAGTLIEEHYRSLLVVAFHEWWMANPDKDKEEVLGIEFQLCSCCRRPHFVPKDEMETWYMCNAARA